VPALFENRITLNTDKKDKVGKADIDHRIVNSRKRENDAKDIAAAIAEMMEAAGYKDLTTKPYVFPRKCNHEMGRRMGKDRRLPY